MKSLLLTRRDRCHFIGKRGMTMTPPQAAEAWYMLCEKVEKMGEMDVPKFNDILIAVRVATIAIKHRGDPYGKLNLSWRCFHCDEVFTNPKEAATHFGTVQGAQPVCAIKADEIRHMEWCLARYRDEDTDLHRQIAHLQSEHSVALRRAEESGYAKGLRDGQKVAVNI